MMLWVKISTLLRLEDLCYHTYNNKHTEQESLSADCKIKWGWLSALHVMSVVLSCWPPLSTEVADHTPHTVLRRDLDSAAAPKGPQSTGTCQRSGEGDWWMKVRLTWKWTTTLRFFVLLFCFSCNTIWWVRTVRLQILDLLYQNF